MKNLFILLAAAMVSMTSCKKFLATEPADFISPENYFNTESDLNKSLTGVYDALAQDGTFSRNLVLELAHSSDEGFYKRDDNVITPFVYNYDGSHAIIQACWRQLYQGINRANLLLANVNKPSMNESRRAAIKGQALFLRAYMYFLLVSNWGDVPLLLDPTSSAENVNIPRTPSARIFEQITRDMEEAQTLVQRISDIGFSGRVSKTAVQGILARVYLKWAGQPLNDASKYQLAKNWADSVVQSGEHVLAADYKQIFINHTADKYDIKESMWEIEFYGNNANGVDREGSRFVNQISVKQLNNDYGYGYGILGVTGVLYNKYTDPNDVRRDWTIAPYSYQGNNTNIKVAKASTDIYTREVGKWRREYETVLPYAREWGPGNFPMLRYADVLLMFAEAENQINGPTATAHLYLNMVRARANASQYTGANTISDKTTFHEVIMDERSRELAFEGLRKGDLIRWGVFIPFMKNVRTDITSNAPSSVAYGVRAYNNVSQRHVLLPIPSLEIALNKSMVQNPGW